MDAKEEAHDAAAAIHQKAAEQHKAAAAAHDTAADANRNARNKPAAKLDAAAAEQHQKAAALHTRAALKHKIAAGQNSADEAKASAASNTAGVQSGEAGSATSHAVAADTTSPAKKGSPASVSEITTGQLAKGASDRAVATGSEAAKNGAAASAAGAGDDDDGWINKIVEGLNLTGVTKTMLDHNRFFTLSLVAAFALFIAFVFFYGTEPRIDNPLYAAPGSDTCGAVSKAVTGQNAALEATFDQDPDLMPPKPSKYFTLKRVTEDELKTEVQNYVDAGTAQINRLQADLKLKTQQTADAVAKIEAEKGALKTALTAVAALATASAPATGPIGPLIGIVTGLLTAGLGADNVRKKSLVASNPGSETSTQ